MALGSATALNSAPLVENGKILGQVKNGVGNYAGEKIRLSKLRGRLAWMLRKLVHNPVPEAE